jgi:polar amino acid transport system substrate-binding protein
VTRGDWDVAFLAVDPQRATEISFSAPYVEIEATYLVPPGSLLRTVEDVDRKGVRIAISKESAYDLYLSRNLKQAQLVRAPVGTSSFKLFVDANANLRPVLVDRAEKLPGSRILDGHFSVVGQAVGTPKSREAGAKYVREFVEDIKATGLVAQTIDSNGIRGLTVAPKAKIY